MAHSPEIARHSPEIGSHFFECTWQEKLFAVHSLLFGRLDERGMSRSLSFARREERGTRREEVFARREGRGMRREEVFERREVPLEREEDGGMRLAGLVARRLVPELFDN